MSEGARRRDPDTKRALRRAMRARRDAMTACDRAWGAEALCVRVREAIALPEQAVWAAYVPLGSEIDPGPLYRALGGVQIALPRTHPSEPGVMEMVPLPARAQGLGRAGRWGLREPEHGEPVALGRVGVAIIPALAFDMHGMRLGYGKGYYDRWMRRWREQRPAGIAIGVGYDWQLLDRRVPSQPHDQAVDWVVTPSRAVRAWRGLGGGAGLF